MIDIGVLTFHSADNYGSVLQTFALQRFLEKKFNIISEVIDYRPTGQDQLYKLFAPIESPRNIVGNVLKLQIYFKHKKRVEAFERFREGMLRKSSKSYTDLRDFDNIAKQYKLIIVGSDQVWNPHCVDFSPVYMLDGIHVPIKASYAPSVNEKCIIDKDWYLKCVQNFDYISVREVSSQKFLQTESNQKFGKDSKPITVTVDPTLLLDAEEYSNIAASRLIADDYIFAYSVYNDPAYLEWLDKISKITDMPILTMISGSNSYKLLRNKSVIFAEDQEAFLSAIKHAKYVVTNSFHGTAFSIIFKKNFYYFGDYTKDSRIKTILDNFGLHECAITDVSSDNFKQQLAYTDYDVHMRQIRENSEQFLKEMVLAYENYSVQ